MNNSTQHLLSLSYGKDSMACIEAIKQLGLPLDGIVTVDVWATDTIPADLPEMVKFKEYADKEIKRRYGITVEHICAMREGERLSYDRHFYTIRFNRKRNSEIIYGFPCIRGQWCTSKLKTDIFSKNEENIVQYLGIAADEPERIKRHTVQGKVLPLVDMGWNEAYCRKWCEENNLLSPIYVNATRGGCWFCHNQSVEQLRLLRRDYPDLWELLLEWDKDSPVSFKPDGRTVHDYDIRFKLEEKEVVPKTRQFRWKMIEKASLA